jgi:hypothetical protein
MSKMQDIIDKIEEANRVGATREAIEQVIEAIKLLSKGQQQVMGDLDSASLGPPAIK